MTHTIQLRKPLRITGIDIRNFKRIRSFSLQIDENDNLVTIGGENANGKSSVLDAIENALIGVPRTQTKPVHDGAQGAGIRIQIPPYEVKRLFQEDGTPSLKITRTDDGTEVPNPQKFLKDLIGGIFVDPLEFVNTQPREQRRILADLVGLDMDKIDAKISESRDNERQLDEHQKKLLARVEHLPWHDDAPDEEVSVAELSEQLRAAHEHNNGVTQAKDAVTTQSQNVARMLTDLDRAEAEVVRLKRELDAAQVRRDKLASEHTAALENLANLESAARVMELRDTTEIEERLANAEATNRKVRDNQARLAANQEWQAAEAELGAAIERVKALQAEKKRMLSEAAFPVPGLEFDSEQILLNGNPFRQASHAEQIRCAIAITLAQRGQVAPILIRDASTIDKKMLRIIADEAEKHNAQVFAEIIANLEEDGFDRECSIYVLDGGNTEIQYRQTNSEVIEAAAKAVLS